MNINKDIIKNVINIDNSINNNSDINFIKSKNLIDLSNMLISGGYSDIGYVASTNYITIQYIQVRPNTTYTLSTNLSTSKYTVLRIVDFNSNKTFIRRSSGTTLASSNTFTTSGDAYYIAFCFYTGSTASTSDITQAQCEKGSTATTYQPYITPAINVYGEEIYNGNLLPLINESVRTYELKSGKTYRIFSNVYCTFKMYGIWSTTQFAGYFTNTPSTVSNHLLYGTPSITFADIGGGYQTITIPSNSLLYIEIMPTMSVKEIN